MRAGAERLQRCAARLPGVGAVTPALGVAQQAAVWRVRKVSLGLLSSMKGDMKPVPFIEDAAVPVADLPDYVRQIEAYCAGLDTPISYYAHAGAGCLHIRPLINTRSAAQVARMPDIAQFAAALRHPTLARGIAGMVGFVPRVAPEAVAGRLSKLPVFMAAGERDATVPAEESRRAAAVLRAAGADLEYREYPTEHKMTAAALDDMQGWLQAQV